MAYSPTKSDATAMAADAASRLGTAKSLVIAVVDTLVALCDAILCSTGYQAQNDAFALGSATTTSTSFTDVGNGSSTGFSSWAFTAPVAKTYTIDVNCSAYKSASSGGSQLWFQLLVDGVAQPTTSEMTTFFATNFDQKHFVFSVPVALSTGSHTFKLQWKVSSGMTANVDPATEGRCFRVRG
jgi:hypothetical protein